MLKGKDLLRDPLSNKGLAYSNEERSRLGLHGLMPCGIMTLENQVKRRYDFFKKLTDDFTKSIYLSDVQNRNETVFYRLVLDHLEEMMPLIYTPTVGELSLQFSNIYRHHRGLYVSYPLRHQMDELFANIHEKDIDVIVVTDGERVLGLGDLGTGGMAICIGKLALYSLLGGIYPGKALPIMVDVGTNRKELLDDPLYIGWRHPRIKGKEYEDFLESFVQAVKKKYPKVLLQWEDFGKDNARPLLERYRHKICSFNDDMQGTSAVTLAAILSAVKAAKMKFTEQRFVIVGAGTAGVGIAEQLLTGLIRAGLKREEALSRFYLVDRYGLIHEDDQHVDVNQKKFARKRSEQESKTTDLLKIIQFAKPTILIGVSGQPNIFTKEMIEVMAQTTEHPIIFPLSNPTAYAEAHPQNLLEWTHGKAIIATGSPFGTITYKGKPHKIAQCNNSNIFPGIGLGIIAVKPREVSDEMFLAAADTLSSFSPLQRGEEGIFPPILDLRRVSREIAISVAKMARDQGLCEKLSDQQIVEAVDRNIWVPAY
jgi:malate dehydrogenase (oxaloacetate-decarboxylating)